MKIFSKKEKSYQKITIQLTIFVLLSSDVTICVFTLGAKFTNKETFNDDLTTVTSIFKKVGDAWKIHWLQRSSGDSDLSLWD